MIDGDYDDPRPDGTLGPSESLDSDEVRNDDGDIVVDALFDAVIEATEEAIVNALVAATAMVGRDNITAYAIPHDRLVEVMRAAGR